jgi:hypothetical protein
VLLGRLTYNVLHGRVAHTGESPTFAKTPSKYSSYTMPPQQRQLHPSKEAQIQLALSAIQQDATLSIRRAAAIYGVPRKTLGDRRAGRPSRADIMPNSRKLDKNEEKVIVEHILELDARGFPPRLAAVADMANSLRLERNLGPIGTNWPSTFVKRQDELKTRFNRKYDYKRALCEDSGLIQDWFERVANIKAKYGIQDDDSYNFDEAGFMMGQITTQVVVTASERRGRPKLVQPGNREWATLIQGINAKGWAIPPFIILKARRHLSSWYELGDIPHEWIIAISENGWTNNKLGLEWLKHFHEHTKKKVVGSYRLLIIDGHESHDSLEFQHYCKEKRIITLCMPPHSSHLLQPLDVGCFGPLKKAYGRQVEKLMRNHITHITKLEFLPCFKQAFDAAITSSNIQGGFQGAGLVPFAPDQVISCLDVKLRTPSPPLPNNDPWQSQTPSNALELGSQSTLVKSRIQMHADSSPTSIVEAFEKVSKGAAIIAHKLVLAQREIAELKAANEAATRRKSYKRKQIQEEGPLTINNGARLSALQEFGARKDRKKAKKQVRVEVGEQSQRRCGRCQTAGHNARTCKKAVEVVS